MKSLNELKIAVVSLVAAVALAAGVSSSALATTNKCEVPGTKLGKWGSTFSINDDKITSSFVVKGENCTVVVSLVTFKAPAADAQPLYEQKIYDYKTVTLGPGEHSLTVKLPDCYYQADLMLGTKSDWAEADNTPKRVNISPDAKEWPDLGLRDFKIGGDKVCTEPEEPKVLPAATTTTPTALPSTGISAGSILGLGFAVTLLGTAIHRVVQSKMYRR